MKNRLLLASVLLSVLVLLCCAPGDRADITTSEVASHIRFLADDLLEGRAVGSRGESLAALYQETQFRLAGVEPFFGDSYTQSFPLKGTMPDRGAVLEVLGGPARTRISFPFKEAFVVESNREDCPEGVEAELVYAGYLIQAPERNWDDIKGVDLRGKALLGSDYFARRLPFGNEAVLANLNLEMTNVWGETEDVYAIGARHSDLDDICRRAAENLGLRYIPAREGNLGYYFRSDQLSFARAGIPSAWLHEGITSRGADKDLIKRKTDDYKKNRYHKVTDQVEPDWDLRGTVQICRWTQEIIRLLGEGKALPQFLPTSSFRRR